MLRLAGEGKTPSVVDDQYGTPTYATDLARALMVLVQRPGEDMELFHYTDGGETTWYDFAVEIFRQADMPVAVVPVDTAGYPTAASAALLRTGQEPHSGRGGGATGLARIAADMSGYSVAAERR